VITSTFGKTAEAGSAAGGGDFRSQALTDIKEAFDSVVKSNPDVLDTSHHVNDKCKASLKAYDLSTAKIES
jgi:hypothetical protein